MSARLIFLYVWAISLNKQAHQAVAGENIFLSRHYGRDFPECGSYLSPCSTLAHTVEIAGSNDCIFINGSLTNLDPYTCERSRIQSKDASAKVTEILVRKSLHFIGFSATVHLRCGNLLQFISFPFTEAKINVSFYGIVFLNTSITFVDSSVSFLNCTFLQAVNPIVALAFTQEKVVVSVEQAIFFENTGCIHAELSNSTKLVIEVNDTEYLRNKPSSNQQGSAIAIEGSSSAGHQAQINISCKHTLFSQNAGPVITNSIEWSQSYEQYLQVTFRNNNRDRFSMDSLYASKAQQVEILFDTLLASQNLFTRLVRLCARSASLKIVNSRVQDHKLIISPGAGIFVEAAESIQTLIRNTSFKRNVAESGGAVALKVHKGRIKLTVWESNFTENKASAYDGGAISVEGQMGFVAIAIENTTFMNCTANRYGGAIYVSSQTESVFAATNSRWVQNRALQGAAATILLPSDNQSSYLRSTVQNCQFLENHDGQKAGVFSVYVSVGSIEFSQTQWSKNTYCFYMLCDCTARFKDMNISSTTSTVINMQSAIYQWRNMTPIVNTSMNLSFERCVLDSNKGHHILVDAKTPYFSLSLDDVKINGRKMLKKGGKNILKVHLLHSVKLGSTVSLHNVMVERAVGAAAVIFLFKNRNNTVTVSNSYFRKIRSWYSTDYLSTVSPLSIVVPKDDMKPPACDTPYLTYTYRNTIVIEDTSFEDNIGRISGGIYLSNGNVTMRRCRFLNNFAIENGGHIRISDGTGTIAIENSSFKQTNEEKRYQKETFSHATSISSDGTGSVILRNTLVTTDFDSDSYRLFRVSKAGAIRFDGSTKLQCAIGSWLRFDNYSHFTELSNKTCSFTTTVFTFSCHRCAQGLYSLARGEIHGLGNDTKAMYNPRSFCHPCPPGANCSGNIIAYPNFWGYIVLRDPVRLKFISCPPDYCKKANSKHRNLSVYNVCSGNRSGFMCGKCKEGFTEALFSKRCKKVDDCYDYWVWVVMATYSVVMALFLIQEPPIVRILVRNILWFRRREGYQQVDQEKPINRGYTNILFYFYQIASYLAVEPFHDLVKKTRVVSFFSGIFNFRTGVSGGLGCPFPGLTVITKELFLTLNVFATMFSVLAIFGFHCTLNKVRGRPRPSSSSYAAGTLKTLLLGYATLANTALKLLTCVPVLTERRLYYDGNIKCWTWWQQLLVIYLVADLVPFVAVIYWGAMKLQRTQISGRHFLGACFFPLGFLFYWTILRMLCRGKQQERVGADDTRHVMLRVLHEPFTSFYWQSVLIGRRFLLLSLQVLFPDPLLRLFSMSITCLVVFTWHVGVKPFRDWKANIVEAISLAVLIVIATINLVEAMFLSAGVTPRGTLKHNLRILERIEISLLGIVPLLSALLCAFAIISQAARIFALMFRWLAASWRRILGFLILRRVRLQGHY